MGIEATLETPPVPVSIFNIYFLHILIIFYEIYISTKNNKFDGQASVYNEEIWKKIFLYGDKFV